MNPIREKEISVTFGLPGVGNLITQTGKFKEILSFSEGIEFMILSCDDNDVLINLGYVISWTVKDPPDDYVKVSTQESGDYIR